MSELVLAVFGGIDSKLPFRLKDLVLWHLINNVSASMSLGVSSLSKPPFPVRFLLAPRRAIAAVGASWRVFRIALFAAAGTEGSDVALSGTCRTAAILITGWY